MEENWALLLNFLPLFRPGDISWKKQRPQSVWREFNFSLHQIQRAVEPELSLEEMINDWNNISRGLAERARNRRPQQTNYF